MNLPLSAPYYPERYGLWGHLCEMQMSKLREEEAMIAINRSLFSAIGSLSYTRVQTQQTLTDGRVFRNSPHGSTERLVDAHIPHC